MFKDKRVGVIQSDVYNNSIYTDNCDINSHTGGKDSKDNLENDEACSNRDDCFNDYRDSIQNTYFNDEFLDDNENVNVDDNYMKNGSLLNKSRALLCNLCKLDSHNDYLILSCCNTTFHIKCLINKYTKDVFRKSPHKLLGSSGNHHYEYLNESTITQESFDNMMCLNCNDKLNYEDIFTLYSKNIMSNKKFHTQHITQLNKLNDQKIKIENEIKCLNEYIDKLNNDKKVSKIIMDKTYKLISE